MHLCRNWQLTKSKIIIVFSISTPTQDLLSPIWNPVDKNLRLALFGLNSQLQPKNVCKLPLFVCYTIMHVPRCPFLSVTMWADFLKNVFCLLWYLIIVLIRIFPVFSGFWNLLSDTPDYICWCCSRLWYQISHFRRSVFVSVYCCSIF